MARRSPKKPKKEIVAFKVEAELAEFLDKLQNKSDFIRKAIIAQLGMACPLCSGSGVVPRGLHDHYEPILRKNSTRKCDHCGHKEQLPRDVMSVPEPQRPRLEQFLHGGPLFCEECYAKTPACDDCGWHIPLERSVEHHRQAHAT
jgi:hypothetical protein